MQRERFGPEPKHLLAFLTSFVCYLMSSWEVLGLGQVLRKGQWTRGVGSALRELLLYLEEQASCQILVSAVEETKQIECFVLWNGSSEG